MSSNNKSTTFTINIDTNLTGLLRGTEQAKKALSSIFTSSNLGQSMAGDFNKLNKILTRIQNTASGPIRSDWGAENLIADFTRAGVKVDDIISKLEEIKKDKDLRIDILDENEIKDFQKTLDYSKKLGQQLEKNKAIQAEITRLAQEETKAITDEATKKAAWEKAKRSEAAAKGQLTKTKKAYGIENYTRDEFKEYWKTNLANYLNKSGEFNALGTRLGFSKSLLGGNDLLDVKSIINKAATETRTFKNDSGVLVTENVFKTKKELEDLEGVLNDINEKKQKALDFEVRTTNLTNAQKEVAKTEEEYTKAASALTKIQTEINKNKGQLTNTFNTQEWQEFAAIAQQVGVNISNINQNSGIDEIQQKIQEVSDAMGGKAVTNIDQLVAQLDKLRQENIKVRDSSIDVIEAQKKEHEQMKNVDAITNRIKMFTGFYGILNLVRRSIRSAISTIKELDEQMTKMAVVTSPTISDYWKQLPQYTKRANALGAAIKEVYEADTLYYQQGLKTNQVIAVSNETMKMARIAALDAAEATDRMTSAMRGFNMEINETSAQRVNDVYSQLAAITASDVNEISVAMTKTASIAHSAGMEFETTAAFLSQIIETTRESADTAGTALKTIIARFEELKKSPTEIGEIDGETIDANKIETALRSVGIALRDAQGQFRNLDDVFLELSGKWDSLDKNTQRYIATIAAGSRQQSRFIAMMQNYAHTTDLVAKANGSAGASQEQFEKTLDSMKTKLNALKNAWDTFTMGILESNALKDLVKMGTSIIEVLNKVGKAVDKLDISFASAGIRLGILIASLRTLGIVGRKAVPYLVGKGQGLMGYIAGKGTLAEDSPDATGSMSLFQGIMNRGLIRKNIKAARKNEYERLWAHFESLGYSEEEITSTIGKNPKKLPKAIIPDASGPLPQNAEKSFSNFGSGLVSVLPALLKFVAAIAAIVAVIKGVKAIIANIKYNSQEEKIKRDKEALESYQTAIENTKNKIDELTKSQEEYNELVEKLATYTPGTSEWTNQVIKVNQEVIKLVKSYKELAPYVSTDTKTGQLVIKQEGFNAVNDAQQKEMLKWQKMEIAQMRKVYSNQDLVNAQNFKELYGDLADKLSTMSIEQLQSALLDDNSIQNLSEAYDESVSTVQQAVGQLLENKQATELNTAQLNILSKNISNETSAPQVALERMADKYVDENWEKVFEEFDSRGTYEKTNTFKEMLNYFKMDYSDVKGLGDTELLAGLKGLTKGETWAEGVEKYSGQTKWGVGTRDEIAEDVVKAYLKLRYMDEKDSEVGSMFTETEKAILNGDIESLSIEDIKTLDMDEAALRTGAIDEKYIKYRSGDKDISEYISRNYQGFIDNKKGENEKYFEETSREEIRKDYAEWLKDYAGMTEEEIEKALKDLEDYFTPEFDIEQYIKDTLDRIYNGHLQTEERPYSTPYDEKTYGTMFQDEFENLGISLVSSLLSHLDRTFERNLNNPTALRTFENLYSNITSEMSNEQENKFAEIIGLYDWTNTVELEKMRDNLKDTGKELGLTDYQIEGFIKQLGDLNIAIEKVDFKVLLEGLNQFAATVEKLRLGEFEGQFSDEEYEKMIKSYGFKAEEFIRDLERNVYIYRGTENELYDRLVKTLSPGSSYREAIATVGQQEAAFKNIGSKDEITSVTVKLLKTSLMGVSEEVLKVLGLQGFMDANGKEVINMAKDFFENFWSKRQELEDSTIHADEILAQALGNVEENAYKQQKGYDESSANGLIAQITASDAVSDADKQNLLALNKIMAEGGEEAQKYQKVWAELTARLANTAGISKASAKMEEGASKIKGALDSIGDSAVNTETELNEIQETLAHFKVQGVEHMNYDQGEAYKTLFELIGDENQEAYETLIELISMSNSDVTNVIETLSQEGSLISEKLKDLALMFEGLGFGHINATTNAFDWFRVKDWADKINGDDKNKDKEKNPWENPYDWLWNITEQINKNLYQRERLERKYKLAVEDSVKSAEDLYEISKKELDNLQEQARLQSLKGQKATEEASLLLSHYKEYAKYVSMNPLTGQVQVDYEGLDRKGWSQEQGSAFENFVSRLTELASEIKESNKSLEEIEDEVKEIQLRGRDEMLQLESRVKEALVTERQREIDTLEQVNEAITNQQAKLLDAMRDEIDETRRIRENTDKQEEIEKKRQKLAYLQRDTSGANQTEILSLQEEIEKDTLSYGDALIDQSLQKMQEDNELAAEKRQEQIDIANFQLQKWTESGEIWESVREKLDKFFAGDSGSLQQFIQDQENWQSLSALQQEDFDKEFIQTGKLAQAFDEGKIAAAAETTATQVSKYADDLESALVDGGVLGNKILDLGKNLNVTLKDFNPKEDKDTSNSGNGKTVEEIKKILGDLYQYIKDYILPKSTGIGNPSGKADLITGIEQNLSRYGRSRAELEVRIGEKLDNLSTEELSMLTTFLNEKKYDLDSADSLAYIKKYKKYRPTKYKTGGLNTQTGPAWLDGTPTKPEAVFNAEETRALYTLVDGVSTITKSNDGKSGGDNYFNVEVNVDEISNDYDVDRAIERVKQAILEDSQYRNVNFISGLTY